MGRRMLVTHCMLVRIMLSPVLHFDAVPTEADVFGNQANPGCHHNFTNVDCKDCVMGLILEYTGKNKLERK